MTSTSASAPLPPPPPPGGTGQAEAVTRLIEAAHQVRRRYQFFVWLQSHLQGFVPHRVAVCGAYQRQRKSLTLELFNGVPLEAAAELALVDAQAPLVQALVRRWVAGAGRPAAVKLQDLRPGETAGMDGDTGLGALASAGLDHWLVHGVARPQRPHELESLFLFSTPGRAVASGDLHACELLMPQIHAAYLRMLATEFDLDLAQPPAPPSHGTRAPITQRERQILGWVREGKSNQQIGETLDISPLTVKNHVQKILRKLGANNRAQAVAKAIALNLLGDEGSLRG